MEDSTTKKLSKLTKSELVNIIIYQHKKISDYAATIAEQGAIVDLEYQVALWGKGRKQ